MKTHKILIIIYLISYTASLSAQALKDSISTPMPVKFNLYQNFNEGKMRTSDNKEVNYLSHIKNKIRLKNKPTLVFTWASFDMSSKRVIDSLLISKVYEKYNIVIINRNPKSFYDKDEKFISTIDRENPLYAKKLVSLFDFHNLFGFHDREATPILFWLDTDFNIVTSTLMSRSLSINGIEKLLSLVESKTITSSRTKFFNGQWIPSTENEALLKRVIEESNETTNIKLVYIPTDEILEDFDFTKSKEGTYWFKNNNYKPFVPYKAPDFSITRNVGLKDREPNLYKIKSDFTLIYFCDISTPEAKGRLETLYSLIEESNNAENTNGYKSLHLDIVVVFIGDETKFESNNKFEANTESRKMANLATYGYYKVFDKDEAIQKMFVRNSSGAFHLLDSNKTVIYESDDDVLFHLDIKSLIKK
jgi:hypothetical protein